MQNISKKVEFSKIGICLTDRCNAECRMCCFSCNPRNSQHYHEKELENIVEQAAGISNIKAIGITGGEAMLYPKEVHFAIRQITAHGIKPSLTSNGFWAKTEDKAYEELKSLKAEGLNDLSVSIDAYHMEYVDIDCLKNLLRANQYVGIRIRVALGDVKNEKRAYEILKELGNDIYETPIVVYPFMPVGKGQSLEEESTRYRAFEKSWECPAGGELMITPSGDTYPCCSQAVYGSIFSKGNIHEKSLAEIIEDYQHFCFFSLLRNKGFQWFYDILTQKEKVELPKHYVSPCHLCYTIFTDKVLCEKLKFYYEQELIDNVKNILKL